LIDALDDPKIAVVMLATRALDQGRREAFRELRSELGHARAREFVRRVETRHPARFDLREPEQGRTAMLEIKEGLPQRRKV
jgi:hypothetical protein